jgi:hypothetical protein
MTEVLESYTLQIGLRTTLSLNDAEDESLVHVRCWRPLNRPLSAVHTL